MNLYELTGAYKQLQELIECGEDYEAVLDVIDDAIEDKADAYAKVMRNNEATIEAIKYEIDRLQEKRKRLEQANERLKSNLFMSMKHTGKEKFKTNLFNFSISKNGGKSPVILRCEVEKLPTDLCSVTYKPNLDAIREYIEKTGDVTYAEIGERGESLRIK